MSEAGSGIEGFRHKSAFAQYVADRLGAEPFRLVDVGCAGGLAPGWRAFGDRLAALGFDTNAEEVARLQAAEQNPAVRYVAGWVDMPDGHPLKTRIGTKAYWHQWPSRRLAYERTYDLRKARAEGREPPPVDAYFHDEVLTQSWLTTPVGGYDLDYARTFAVHPVSETEAATALDDAAPDRVIHLPPYLQAAGFGDADFVKLDIDGPDYEVLRSLSALLAGPALLGVSLEVSYYGSHDANDNSFHNMDRLMREKGFDLFGLSVRNYASAALPFPYLDAHPSMSTGGRPLQGDALYVRDLASRVRAPEAAGLSVEKLAKTAALYALFNLPDCAAEMLLVHRARLAAIMDVEAGLDLLAAQIQEDDVIAPAYRDYMAAFEAEDPRFFDIYSARNKWWHETLQAAKDAPRVNGALADAERRLAEAQAQLEAERGRAREQAREQQEALSDLRRAAGLDRQRIADLEASTSWRLTAPLRAVTGAMKGRRG